MNNTENESGRSMVEMLGVLAVMGVLSVGGVAMYTSAMNKHRANEILNEASKRAVMVAGQAMAGKTGTISLSEFGNNAVSGATFGTEAKVENNQIKLTLSGVESSICTKMKAALGDNTVMAVDNDCTIIAFNADMTKGVAKPTSCNPACTGGKECVNGTCQCPDDKSLWIGSTCVAKATCTENQWYNAVYNRCDAKATCTSSQWYNANTNGCEAKKTCASDEYYWPQLNYCGGEVDCWDAESDLHTYYGFTGGSVDANKETMTCACPTGTTAFFLWSYPYCCPNNMNIIMGQCISGTCNGTWYCNGELDSSGNCVDSVECCEGTVVMGQCVVGTCSTSWYCSGSGVYVLDDPCGGIPECCPNDKPYLDIDEGQRCISCKAGSYVRNNSFCDCPQNTYYVLTEDDGVCSPCNHGSISLTPGGASLCTCDTGFHWSNDAIDCVAD